MKITVIGAGSTYTPELVEGICTSYGRMQITDIALMDIDKASLDLVGNLAVRQLRSAGYSGDIVLTEDLSRALDGAYFVFTQVRPGKMACRILDEKLPLKYGLLGQETTGAGGFMQALRTVPVIMDIAGQMNRLAADGAWLINFSNPSGIIAEAVLNLTDVNMIGLCNCPINMIKGVADALEEMGVGSGSGGLAGVGSGSSGLTGVGSGPGGSTGSIGVGSEPGGSTGSIGVGSGPGGSIGSIGVGSEPGGSIGSIGVGSGSGGFDYEYVGLNHLSWITKVVRHGETTNMAPLLADIADTSMKNNPIADLDEKLVRAVPYVPSSYLNYYYMRSEQVQKCIDAEKTRGEICVEIEEKLRRQYADPDLKIKPPELAERGGALYSTAALSAAESIMLDKREMHVVTTRNTGKAVPFMDESDAVEVLCELGSKGVAPQPVTVYNDYIVGLMKAVKAYEKLTVRAAIEGDRNIALSAMMAHPLIGDIAKALPLLEEMLEANKKWLPGFFK